MIVTYLRSSSYSRYSFCELYYCFEYMLSYRDSVANASAVKGNMCHKALECVALSTLAKKNGEKTFLEEETGTILNVDDYEGYIRLGFDHYDKSSPHEFAKKDKNDVTKWFNIVMESEYNPELLDIIAPEQKFDIVIEEDWARYKFDDVEGYLGIKGTMDLAYRADGLLYLLDYKTGRRVDWNKAIKNKWGRWDAPEKTYECLCNDHQILMYYYAACKKFGIQDMVFVIYFITQGGPFEIPLTVADYHKAEAMIRARFEEIRDNELPKRIKTKYGFHDRCSWCPHSKDNKVWDATRKEWKEISTNACDFIHGEICKKGISEVQRLYGIEGGFAKYGDGGGRSE